MCMCQPSRSFNLWLNEAEFEHEVNVSNLPAGGQKSEKYFKVNPAGQVPTLVGGDFVLPEGAATLRYVDSKHKLTSWLGENAQTQAKVHKWMHWHHSAMRKSAEARKLHEGRQVLRPRMDCCGSKRQEVLHSGVPSFTNSSPRMSLVTKGTSGENSSQ